mgnify:CR=1 FL=1
MKKYIQDKKNNKDVKLNKDIIKDSSDFLIQKVIGIEKNKLKIDKIIYKIIKEDPIKAKKIIEEKKEKKIIEEIKKPKKIKKIEDVIDENISPN